MTISLQKLLNSLEELRRIEHENERRKNLIRLAVLRVVTLTGKSKRAKKSNAAPSPELAVEGDLEGLKKLSELNQEYVVVISKLKQLYATKEQLQESKIEALKEEVDKLKLELKWKASTSKYELNKHVPFSQGSGAFKSSYLNSNPLSNEYLSPPSKALFSSNDHIDSILSPLKITKSKNRLASKKPTKGDIFNNNTNELYTMLNHNHETPRKSPSRLSFVQNFDNSHDSTRLSFVKNIDSSKDSIQTPTKPNKLPRGSNPSKLPRGDLSKLPKDYSPVPFLHSTANNLEVSDGSDDDDDTFVSAHMSVSSDTSDNGPKRKKRKLQILTSQASKIQIANVLPRDISGGLHLEDEDVNTLNYYHDDNFQDDSFNEPLKHKVPVQKSVKTPAEAVQNPVKTKKNVFKID